MSGGYEGPEWQLRALTSWGWRCSAAGGSLRAVLGRYATCGRPVLCSAGRGGAGGEVRVAPKTGGFRCLSTFGLGPLLMDTLLGELRDYSRVDDGIKEP